MTRASKDISQRQIALKSLQRNVSLLPDLLIQLESTKSHLGTLSGSFSQLETLLDELEMACEDGERARELKTKTDAEAAYASAKSHELKKYRDSLEGVRRKQDAARLQAELSVLSEKRKVYDEQFKAQIEAYKRHGVNTESKELHCERCIYATVFFFVLCSSDWGGNECG